MSDSSANARLIGTKHPRQSNSTAATSSFVPQATAAAPHYAAPSSMVMQRQCPRCTYFNDEERAVCDMCGQGLANEHAVYTNWKDAHGSTSWPCVYCQEVNPSARSDCYYCGAMSGPKPTTVSSRKGKEVIVIDDQNTWMDDAQYYEQQRRLLEEAKAARQAKPVKPKEEEVDLCVLCLNPNPTHAFMPCGHTVLCKPCADGYAVSNSKDPRCFICRAHYDRIAMASSIGMSVSNRVPAAPRAQGAPDCSWQPVRSTFPWIGGEISRWDGFLKEIQVAADRFLEREVFESGVWERNQVSVRPCNWNNVLAKFKDGWASLACPEGPWCGLFGWHCSNTMDATFAIAKDGWDPATRSKNNHGPGEYFGVHHSQVFEYARARRDDPQSRFYRKTTLLLAFVLRGEHVKWVEDFCYVVNNPTDEDSTYCLPLFTVQFPNSPPEKRWAVPRMPYRWQFQWENDEKNDFISYEWSINTQLNTLKTRMFAGQVNQHDDSQCAVVVEIRRDDPSSDGTRQQYAIRVNRYVQENLETNFVRRVELKCVPAIPLPKTLWMMLMPRDETWVVLDMFCQRTLSEAYFKYRPDELSLRQGEFPSRRATSRVAACRYANVIVHGHGWFVDLERLQLHRGSIDAARRKGPMPTEGGQLLAVVDS